MTTGEENTTVAGKARWGELPTAAPVDSDDGQDLLDRGWKATKKEFERNLERVKEALDEFSDEAIMRDEGLARHTFHQVGAYDGPTVFLYNEYANGIRYREQLEQLLEESADLWIVPADIEPRTPTDTNGAGRSSSTATPLVAGVRDEGRNGVPG